MRFQIQFFYLLFIRWIVFKPQKNISLKKSHILGFLKETNIMIRKENIVYEAPLQREEKCGKDDLTDNFSKRTQEIVLGTWAHWQISVTYTYIFCCHGYAYIYRFIQSCIFNYLSTHRLVHVCLYICHGPQTTFGGLTKVACLSHSTILPWTLVILASLIQGW